MKLAIAQMVLGVLMVAAFVTLVAVGLRWFSIGISPYFIFPILGLAVLGCGIAQYLKARKVRIKL